MIAHVKRQQIVIVLTESEIKDLSSGCTLTCLPDHGDAEFIIEREAGTALKGPQPSTGASL